MSQCVVSAPFVASVGRPTPICEYCTFSLPPFIVRKSPPACDEHRVGERDAAAVVDLEVAAGVDRVGRRHDAARRHADRDVVERDERALRAHLEQRAVDRDLRVAGRRADLRVRRDRDRHARVDGHLTEQVHRAAPGRVRGDRAGEAGRSGIRAAAASRATTAAAAAAACATAAPGRGVTHGASEQGQRQGEEQELVHVMIVKQRMCRNARRSARGTP